MANSRSVVSSSSLVEESECSFTSQGKRRTGLVYDERMLKHVNSFNPNHPECPERIERTWAELTSSGLLDRCTVVPAREASEEEVLLVHDEKHYEMISTCERLSEDELMNLSGCYSSIYLNSSSFEVAKLGAGGVLELTEQVINGKVDNGFALVRPPGHHAECLYAMGFCLFNGVAIAAKKAVEKLGLKRVLIVDWDVHHGNGTQNMFYDDKRIMYVSLHRFDHGYFYPGRDDAGPSYTGGPDAGGYNVNVAWNRSVMGDSEYLAAFHHVIMPIACEFAPELVLVSCGFDAARGDPLGGYDVTPDCYAHMTHMLTSLARGKIVFTLEGGYNLSSISDSTASIVNTLLGDFPLPRLQPHPLCDSAVKSIRETAREHSKYWKSMEVFAEAVETSEEAPSLTPPADVVTADFGRTDPVNSLDEVRKKLTGGPRSEDQPPMDTEPIVESQPGGSSEATPTVDKATPTDTEATPTVDEVTPGPSTASGRDTITKDEIFGVMEEFGHTQLFAVTPLPWCRHLADGVKPLPPAGIDASACCEVCSVKQEPWVCLDCYHVYCGRYVNRHMVDHYDGTGHCVVISLADISVWCFHCDSYLDNRVLNPAKNSAHLSKFGITRPGPSQ